MPRKETTIVKCRSRGRITIPAAIRRRLGIKPGDRLFVYLYNNSSIWVGKTRPPENPDLPGDFINNIKAAKNGGKFKPLAPRQKGPSKTRNKNPNRDTIIRVGAGIWRDRSDEEIEKIFRR